MADLLDIAPSTSVEVVKIDGKRVVVHGLAADAVAHIAARFPELVLLLGGGGNVTTRLLERFGGAVGPIIAAGCGHLGDEKYERHAAKLLLEHQLKLITAIVGLTFPNGLDPFVKAMATIGSAGEGEKPVKVRLRKSPSASPPSLDEASRRTMQ